MGVAVYGQVAPKSDSIAAQDSAVSDSLKPKKNSSAITSTIFYKAEDSVYIDLTTHKARLYNKSELKYGQVELTADQIQVDFDKQEVQAEPGKDSLGNDIGIPHFKDPTQEFDSKEILYNFKSGRGLIRQVVTKENDMYVHGSTVKKMEDNVTYIKNARFTACELEHPHFDIRTTRAKIIPGDKIVTGGTMLFIEDVPTPLALPFALFPNTTSRRSGIIIPAYGESKSQGFYLKDGGFFWAVNDYISSTTRGSIYTYGDWDLRQNFDYAKRYKFSGNFGVMYSLYQTGEKGTETYSEQRGLQLVWSHRQDPKANPRGTFSANVNFQNSSSTQHSYDPNQYLNNTTTSSIAYSTKLGKRFNLNVTANESYSTQTRKIDMLLPSLALSMQTLYPLERKTRSGDKRWYESVSLSYNMKAQNKISAQDSLFFTQETFDNMQNGLQHSLGTGVNIPVMRFFTWNHNISYTERWYLKTYEKSINDTTNQVVTTPVDGFSAGRDFGYSTSLGTTLYGLAQFKEGLFRGIRHTMNPSLGFSYVPDFTTDFWNYYKTFTDTNGNVFSYSKYDGTVYGGPPRGKSGSIGFSIGNTLEIKVRNKKDSVTGTRKIKLLEAFNLGTSYNLFADSLNLAPLSLSARTTLPLGIVLNYAASFDFYMRDTLGRRYNKFRLIEEGRLFQRDNSTWSFNIGWNYAAKPRTKSNTSSINPDENEEQYISPFANNLPLLGEHPDFSIPWSIGVNYTFNYRSTFDYKRLTFNDKLTQTLGVNGKISLTDKWQIGYMTGYDFEAKKMSYTHIDISRDLHCWEMSFAWTPFGYSQNWSFRIAIKTNMLKDTLKYDKDKTQRGR